MTSPQSLNGSSRVFTSWSDGGSASHAINTPLTPTTYTAVFRVGGGTGGAGSGLSATYYNNKDLTGSTLKRVDGVVNFDWGTGSPGAAIGAETFSARWTGQVQPEFTETYTFYTQSNDGVRLWVNGSLLVSNWTDHTVTENSGSIALVSGRNHIRMEFYENTGSAIARLRWSSASTPKAIVPKIRLYPTPGG